MAELESVIEDRLIKQLCSEDSQWTYRPDIRNEKQLWDNFKYILEQNNKAKLGDVPLSESEFAKVKKVKAYPNKNLIKVNGVLDHNQVYVLKEDFEFVEKYIISRCHCHLSK